MTLNTARSQIISHIIQYPLHTKAACIVCEIFVTTWFAHQARLDNIELLRWVSQTHLVSSLMHNACVGSVAETGQAVAAPRSTATARTQDA